MELLIGIGIVVAILIGWALWDRLRERVEDTISDGLDATIDRVTDSVRKPRKAGGSRFITSHDERKEDL